MTTDLRIDTSEMGYEAVRLKAIELYEGGTSASDISDMLNMQYRSVSNWLCEHLNVPSLPRGQRSKKYTFTEEDAALIRGLPGVSKAERQLKLLLNGMTVPAAAMIEETSVSNVYSALRTLKLGLRGSGRRPGKYFFTETEAATIRQDVGRVPNTKGSRLLYMLLEGSTTREAADAHGTNTASVHSALYAFRSRLK